LHNTCALGVSFSQWSTIALMRAVYECGSIQSYGETYSYLQTF
jgi:hypothetical protein